MVCGDGDERLMEGEGMESRVGNRGEKKEEKKEEEEARRVCAQRSEKDDEADDGDEGRREEGAVGSELATLSTPPPLPSDYNRLDSTSPICMGILRL